SARRYRLVSEAAIRDPQRVRNLLPGLSGGLGPVCSWKHRAGQRHAFAAADSEPVLSLRYVPLAGGRTASAKRRGISVAQAGHLRESVEPECRGSVLEKYVLPGRLRWQPRREFVGRRGHQLLRSHARRSSEPELRQHYAPAELGL